MTRNPVLAGEPYFRYQSLRLRMAESVCLAQSSAPCVPYLTRHDANSEQLLISQNEGWSTLTRVIMQADFSVESQSLPLYRYPVILDVNQILR